MSRPIYKHDYKKTELLGKKKVEPHTLSAHSTITMFISGTDWLTVRFTAATPGASTSCQLIFLKITFKIHAKEA